MKSTLEKYARVFCWCGMLLMCPGSELRSKHSKDDGEATTLGSARATVKRCSVHPRSPRFLPI